VQEIRYEHKWLKLKVKTLNAIKKRMERPGINLLEILYAEIEQRIKMTFKQ
jgi:hypothetical protein